MISALLAILKFLGILILAVLGLVLVILLLVLFVPVRYKITAHRKMDEEAAVEAKAKITWLAHILNIAFSYPDAAYVRVRLFCFTVFRTEELFKTDSDEKKNKRKKLKSDKSKVKGGEEPETPENEAPMETAENEASAETAENEAPTETAENEVSAETAESREQAEAKDNEAQEKQPAAPGRDEEKKSFINKFMEFFGKLIDMLRNIRYTIAGIYDKIKQIVNNIQYYISIIRSETFGRAWGVCSTQALSLLRSIGPRKITGDLLIGTGDPASTGQVMAAYGILYPLIGDHIAVTPDFERRIVEGDLLIKGKITVFKAVKTAWIIYFNRDLRRLIKLFKKGGSLNGGK